MFISKLKDLLRTCLVLAAAVLSAIVVIYAYNWLIPYGAVVTYYGETDLERPVWKSPAKALEFWSKHSPCIGAGKKYSCRWDGYLDVPASTNYGFAVLNNGGLRLYLDDKLVIDNWEDKYFYRSGKSCSTNLIAGMHKIRVEYYCSGSYGRMRVEWAGGAIPPRTIIGGKYLRKNN